MFIKRLLATLLSSYCIFAGADDTELFVSDVSGQNEIRPQVLIIFDNSGSMRSAEEVVAEPYDASNEIMVLVVMPIKYIGQELRGRYLAR